MVTKKKLLKRQAKKDLENWVIAVKFRDNNVCQVCGNKNNLNAHHIVPRQYLSLRCNIDNGITLCPYCHRLGKKAAHQNSIWFSEWLKKNKPDQWEKLNYLIQEV